MSDTDECIHGLGLVAACVICNGRAKREAAEQSEAWRTFPAKFAGQCSGCDLPISIGQTIAWRPNPGERGAPAYHDGCQP